MDKMFYTLDEAAKRLDKSRETVIEMASRGQLQEFRDRDKLMFKREQVDLLADRHEESLLDGISILEPENEGSGELLDLARPDPSEESGCNLLEDVYGNDTISQMTTDKTYNEQCRKEQLPTGPFAFVGIGLVAIVAIILMILGLLYIAEHV